MKSRLLLASVALVAISSLAVAADKDKRANTKIDPQFAAAVRQMFDKIDKDKDGYLDKTELAKYYRGATAKPAPDPVPVGEEKTETKKPAQRPLPDAEFLKENDKDGDMKVSYEEFEDASSALAEQMKKATEQQRKAMQQFQQQRGNAYQQQMQRIMQQMQRGRPPV
jgi:histidinol dehydrogenase